MTTYVRGEVDTVSETISWAPLMRDKKIDSVHCFVPLNRVASKLTSHLVDIYIMGCEQMVSFHLAVSTQKSLAPRLDGAFFWAGAPWENLGRFERGMAQSR